MSEEERLWNTDETLRVAGLLRHILVFVFLGNAFVIALAVVFSWTALPVVWATLVAFGFAYLSAVLGKVRIASLIIVSTLLGAALHAALIGDGVRDVGLSVLPICIVLSSYLLNRSVFAFTTASAVLIPLVVHFIRQGAGVWEEEQTGLLSEALMLSTVLCVTAIAIRLLMDHIGQALDTARAQERRFRKIFNNIQDVYFEAKPDGRILEVSPSGSRFSGIPREKLIKSYLQDFAVHPEQVEHFLQQLLTNGRVREFETILRDSRNHHHFINIRAALQPDEELGDVIIVGSARDISDRKRLQTQLLQAQKMEAIGRFAGGIAHDFKNYLNVISGYAQMGTQLESNPTIQKRSLQGIVDASQAALDLTQQILTFCRGEDAIREKLFLEDTVSKAIPVVEELTKECAGLRFVTSSRQSCILADPSQIEQVLINFVTNARDAILEAERSPGEGLIVIEIEAASMPRTGKPAVSLRVSDNGVGIDPESRENILEPFFTTKPKGKGTGLGLATVYSILTQNNAEIEIESEVGVGTTMIVYWPIASEADLIPDYRVTAENRG